MARALIRGEQHGTDKRPLQKRIFINVNEDLVMAHQSTSLQDAKQHNDAMKYWRSWGSWFSWGSPVGLGLFLISVAFSLWLLSQAFGWG